MSETVGCGSLCLRYKLAVCIVNALGNRYDYILVGIPDLLHILEELVHVEINFRKIYQIRRISSHSCQRSRSCQPAGMASHNLNDRHLSLVVYMGILINLYQRGGNVFGCGSKSRTMVRAEQVVVDRLGDTHDAAVVANLLHIFGNLVAGIHGIISAVVEEITHVIFLENFKNLLVIRLILIRIRNLVTAGTQCRGRRIFHNCQLLRILLIHDVKSVIQHAHNPVGSAVNLGDTVSVKTCLDCAVTACIDNRRRTAGLSDDHCTF